jgi:hypothetical protein
LLKCSNTRPYLPGEKVRLLAYRIPDIPFGTIGTVKNRWYGKLCGIETPDGEILRWLQRFELESVDPNYRRLVEGMEVYVMTERLAPPLKRGEIVRIIKVINETDYYEVEFNGRRRLATGYELTRIRSDPLSQ